MCSIHYFLYSKLMDTQYSWHSNWEFNSSWDYENLMLCESHRYFSYSMKGLYSQTLLDCGMDQGQTGRKSYCKRMVSSQVRGSLQKPRITSAVVRFNAYLGFLHLQVSKVLVEIQIYRSSIRNGQYQFKYYWYQRKELMILSQNCSSTC